MKQILKLLIIWGVCQCTITMNVNAQRQQIVSPQVHPDHTVTFRFVAPDATRVELSAQFLNENLIMEKGEGGLWSITTSPVTPDLYPYFFVVDGISVNDPNNVLIFPNERFKNSLVDIQGSTPSIYAVREVPHGKISYKFYKSETLQDIRPLVIYTPPGYNPQDGKKYPVLYLLHGATDTHETWFKVGRVNFILDNLIADGKATPMIVVMPYANPNLTYTGKINPHLTNPVSYTDELLNEVIPYVEKNFSVIPNGANRAIAGFSRGGEVKYCTQDWDIPKPLIIYAPSPLPLMNSVWRKVLKAGLIHLLKN